MAVAQAVIDIVFEDEFLQQVKQTSDYLLDKLQAILPQDQFTIRGQGLLLGIVCEAEVAPFIQQAEAAGLLLVQAGTHVVRLLPPLTVTTEEIDKAINILASILQPTKSVIS